MYRNDGSTTPLWIWEEDGSGTIASDGIHMVCCAGRGSLPKNRDGPLGAELDAKALLFCSNGKVFKTYGIRELTDNENAFDRTVTSFIWLKDSHLDDERMEYTIATKDGNLFTFDIRTGAIVSEHRAWHTPLWMKLACSAAILLAVTVGWRIWRRRAADAISPEALR